MRDRGPSEPRLFQARPNQRSGGGQLPPDLELASAEPEELKRWIRAWSRALDLDTTNMGRAAGLKGSTLTGFMAGKRQRNLSGTTITAVSAALHTLMEAKLQQGGIVRSPIPGNGDKSVAHHNEVMWANVIGFVEAGCYQEAVQWTKTQQYRVAVPVDNLYLDRSVIGLEVRGPSMNNIYPPGTVVICVPIEKLGREPRSGERVVVYRTGNGGIEASIKELRITDDGRWLWPRSSHPDFQAPIRITHEDTDVQIVFIVVGSYRPERIIS